MTPLFIITGILVAIPVASQMVGSLIEWAVKHFGCVPAATKEK